MIRRRWLAAGVVGACAATVCAAVATLAALVPLPMARIGQATPGVLDARGVWLRALPTADGRWRLRTDLAHVDPLFVRRLIALEDARYALHPGVDPVSLARAAAIDLATGRIRSGGSTLTMQLARRLDPAPRTFRAKLVETLRALELNLWLGKRRVLADYLTLTPYGGDLEGVRAAALAWFGHEPDHLSDAEQALLIALPQAPEARRPDRHAAAARAARARILARLQARRLITPAAVALADREPLPTRLAMPALAWQVAKPLSRLARPDEANVVATLDARLQSRLEVLARQTAIAQGPTTSAAILVLEVRTRAVRAAVGSAGLDRPGGWIDATRAWRSPGSVLKPFVYAMAFESGIAAPDTRVDDSQTAYGAYRPRDFDRVFRGEVTARVALAQSLNVPAVHMLAAVGPSVFEQRLRAAGLQMSRPSAGFAGPSLALALGGEGVRLRDVAMLYAALADDGVAKPLAWTQRDAATRPAQPGVRLISAQAAAQVLDILRASPPPGGRTAPGLGGGPALAFKTGTSYGDRDAIAAGMGGGYVVVVWTGRPDGGGRPGLTGREAALPLLFEVFDQLRTSRRPAQDAAPTAGSLAGSLDVAPEALQQMAARNDGPRLVFPPNGAQLQLDRFGASSPGLALAAEGRDVRWYADGAPLAANAATGQTVWRPPGPGFYDLAAVDADGRRVRAHVRVLR